MAQQPSSAVLEIVNANADEFPAISLTINALRETGQPITGLEFSNFQLDGAPADQFRIEGVESIAGDNVPVAIVLAIDTSDSMYGQPLEDVKAAALTLTNSLNPGDSVAIVSFSASPQLVQEFSSDQAVLTTAIESLSPQIGGTALYDASAYSIEIAQSALLQRKSVILLSDGAEYGASSFTRDEALAQARSTDVSVYTIGLGYGSDRSFLDELAQLTGGGYVESPGGQELITVYSDVLDLLRTQYRISVSATVPLDGTIYDLNLGVLGLAGDATSNRASFSIRAPVPVPLVALAPESIPQNPDEFREPITIEPMIVADEMITEISILIDGSMQGSTVIDPVALLPGTHTLQIQARDVDGDIGLFEQTFAIVATPTPTPTSTNTPTDTATATFTPTNTATNVPTDTATNTATHTSSPTATTTHTVAVTPTISISPTTEVALLDDTATAPPTATITDTIAPSDTATPTDEVEAVAPPTLAQFGRRSTATPVDAERISALSTIEQIGANPLTPTAIGQIPSDTPTATQTPTDTATPTSPPEMLTLTAESSFEDSSEEEIESLVRDGLPIESRSNDVAGRDILIMAAISAGLLAFLLVMLRRELTARQDLPTKQSNS
jgi:VWFA-related protein